MEQTCKVTNSTFASSEQDLACLDRLSPKVGGEKILLPPPNLCPDERKRRRLAFRNERNLYHRKCDFTQKPIISVFSPDKPHIVYAKDVWWSDAWDARTYGRDFDFTRPFFEQFAELKLSVPQVALVTSPDADENNCPYINFAGNSKNCHMTFDSDFNEDSYYSNVLKHSKNCSDCSYVHTSELCYECIDCTNCYALRYSQDCAHCSSSSFLHGCIGCSDCFMCTNLRQKKYFIENQSYSKEEYFAKLKVYELSRREMVDTLCEKSARFHITHPKKSCHILKTENCVGDYIINAKNCYRCFNISECEDLRYCDSVYSAKNCMDVSSFGENIECVYNSGTIGINCVNIFMCFVAVLNCSELIYCDNCRQSDHCFGSCSLKRNKYCILNKQYTKADYEKLVVRIVHHMRETGEWGEYYPINISAFGYNETMAGEHFPLSKEQAKKLGANWSDYKPEPPDVAAIGADEIPGDINDVDDEILDRAIICSASGQPFRINRQELQFCRRNRVPLPKLHPDVRYSCRMKKRNPQMLWERPCARTGDPVLTSYPPESGAVVYSEAAYQDLF